MDELVCRWVLFVVSCNLWAYGSVRRNPWCRPSVQFAVLHRHDSGSQRSFRPAHTFLLLYPRSNCQFCLSIRTGLQPSKTWLTVTRQQERSTGERQLANLSSKNVGSCRDRSLEVTGVAAEPLDSCSADNVEEDDVSDKIHQRTWRQHCRRQDCRNICNNFKADVYLSAAAKCWFMDD